MTPVQQATKHVQKLKQFFLEKAPTCLHEPSGQLKYRYVTPTYAVVAGADDKAAVPERSTVGHYLQMYDWDACFFSQGATKVGMNDLAPDVVANFLSLKHADGYIPRTVSPERIWDAGDMCKPFLCQALAFENRYKNQKISNQMLQDLQCYLDYYERNRKDKSGLYRWRNVLESGVDDNLALIGPMEAAKDENESIGVFPDSVLLAVDLSAYLVAEFRAFADIAEYCGNAALAKQYRESAAATLGAIESKMWDEERGMYFNVYPETFEKMNIKSWTGLTPAMLGLAKPERIEQVFRSNVLSEKEFLCKSGMASMSSSEPLFNNAKRGLYGRAIVSHWQGPMWVLPNALVARGLVNFGFKKEAEDLALRVVNTLSTGLEKHGTLYENYDSDTGKPLWAPQFMSWNILTMELLQLLE